MIIFCGLGYFEEQLISRIKDKHIVVIEQDKEKAERVGKEYSNIDVVIGDASSILTWKKLNLEDVEHVIVAFKDSDVSLEVCFFVRKTFKMDTPILVIVYSNDSEEKFAEFGVTLIKPLETAINLVLNKLDKNFSRAIDIGMKKGEIIELNVLSKSHLTDRKLKSIKPSNWHVAAVYRNNEILIPTGNTKIEVGDKIVIFGEPKVLENLANIFLKGIPQFPLQYGKILSYYLFYIKDLKFMDEVLYIFKYIRSLSIEVLSLNESIDKQLVDNIVRNSEVQKDYYFTKTDSIFKNINRVENGINIFPQRKMTFLNKLKIKHILKETIKPTAFLKTSFPYDKIVVCLNSPDMPHILEIGVELVRLFNVEIEAVFTTLPKGLRNSNEEELLQESYSIISDFKSIHKINIVYSVFEGNPVKETLKFLSHKSKALLVIGYERFEPGSFFKPSIAYHLVTKSKLSIILIPQSVD
jgi:hypothetical protein